MTWAKYLLRILSIVTLAVGMSACASSGRRTADLEAKKDIRWLTSHLQDEGVFVTERGSASLLLPATTSARLVLDNREILDVYGFDGQSTAEAKAYEYANRRPQQDVYLMESFVVVRSSRRDDALGLTLYRLLGATL